MGGEVQWPERLALFCRLMLVIGWMLWGRRDSRLSCHVPLPVFLHQPSPGIAQKRWVQKYSALHKSKIHSVCDWPWLRLTATDRDWPWLTVTDRECDGLCLLLTVLKVRNYWGSCCIYCLDSSLTYSVWRKYKFKSIFILKRSFPLPLVASSC